MQFSNNRQSFGLFGNSSVVSNPQKKFDKLIEKVFTSDFIDPLFNRNIDSLIINIDNKKIFKDETIITNKEFRKLPSAKLAEGAIQGIYKLIETYNKYKSLEENYESMLLENSKKDYTKINTALNVNIDISVKYLIYLEKYGLPEDGIFDEEKLEDI